MGHQNNIFQLPNALPKAIDSEIFEDVFNNGKIKIERIVSTGQITPNNEWYDQAQQEWVLLLQGKATLLFDNENGTKIHLQTGDYLLIPAHKRHRVIFTSKEPPCIWLAIFFD